MRHSTSFSARFFFPGGVAQVRMQGAQQVCTAARRQPLESGDGCSMQQPTRPAVRRKACPDSRPQVFRPARQCRFHALQGQARQEVLPHPPLSASSYAPERATGRRCISVKAIAQEVAAAKTRLPVLPCNHAAVVVRAEAERQRQEKLLGE